VPIQPAAVELLAALASTLERWGRWYVFGAQAVIAHGVPRLSADVDVTQAARRHLTSRRDAGVPRASARHAAKCHMCRQQLERRRPRRLVRRRLAAYDWTPDRIREVLRLLEQALGQSDLTPAFESIATSTTG